MQTFHHLLFQVGRHVLVIYHAYGLTAFPTVHPYGDAFHGTVIGFVVNLHFRILGKLERISLVGRPFQSDEDEGQAVSNDIIQVHEVLTIV